MPVRVDIPIRIRVDPGALARRSCCIESALSAAVGRALRKSAKFVLAERGGFVGVQIHPPEFRWCGDGLGEMPQGVRLATHDLVASVLAEAVVSAGIQAAPAKRSGVPDVQPEDVRERVDSERYAPLLRRYLVRSYDGDTPYEAIEVETESESEETGDDDEPVTVFRLMLQTWDNLDYLFELYEQALLYSDERPYLPMDGPGIVGLLFAHHAGGYGLRFYRVPRPQRIVLEYHADRDQRLPNVVHLEHGSRFTSIWQFTLKADKNEIRSVKRYVRLPILDTYSLRWLPAATPAERRAINEEQIRTNLTSELESERQKLAPGLTDAQFRELVNQLISREVSAITDDPTIRGFLALDVGGQRWLMTSHEEAPAELGTNPILVLPRTEIIAKSEARKRAAAAAMAARAQKSKGTAPTGPEGVEGKPSPPVGDPNAIFSDCKDNYSDHSALYPEQYLDDTDFSKDRPLLGEPSLKLLGGDGQPLLTKINWLAGELGISPCEYAGNFCLGAGQAIARQARQLGEYAVTNEAGRAGVITPNNQGNLGFIQFDPQSTPAIAEFQRLARLLDQVIDLGDDTLRVYEAWWENLCGRWYQYPSGWGLAFHVLFHPIKVDAVGNLFKSTCRVLLLQLLEASRSQISARKKNIATYAPVFEVVLRAYFTNKGELLKLKARLEQATALSGIMPGVLNPQSSQSWLELRTDLIAAVNKGNQAPTDSLAIRNGLVFNGDELIGIQDEHANLWTKQSLEQALTQREYLVESIDPLIKQFSDREANFTLAALNQKDKSPALVEYFMKAGDLEAAVLRRVYRDKKVTTEAVVDSILDEMLRQNGDRTSETKSDYDYAFDAAPLHKDAPKSAIPYCSFVLQGIHKLAHDQIGPEFRSNPNEYGWALDYVIGARYGLEQLKWFAETVGITVLSILCPPLGVAVQAVVSVLDYNKALEKKALFRSLIDPDLVISRAEVEAELFAAELGLALTFLPHGKKILSGARTGIEVVSQQGVRKTARAVVTQARRGLSRQGAAAAARAIRERFGRGVAEALKDDFAVALSIELVTDQAMDLFMSKLLIDPIVDSIFREYQDYAQGARGPGRIVSSFAGPGSTGSTPLPGGAQ